LLDPPPQQQDHGRGRDERHADADLPPGKPIAENPNPPPSQQRRKHRRRRTRADTSDRARRTNGDNVSIFHGFLLALPNRWLI